MSISKNRQDRDKAAYIENPDDQGTDRRVQDLVGNGLLQDILDTVDGTIDTTAQILHIAVANKDTEMSQALPANCRGFRIRALGQSKIKLSYTSGQSGTTFFPISPGSVFPDDHYYPSQTLYFQTSKDAETVIIIAYT